MRLLRASRLIVVCLAVALSASATATEPTHPAPRPQLVPSDDALAIIIKTTLMAFNDAVVTDNYSVLRDLAAPSFRDGNSQAHLSEIFQDLRRRNIDLSPLVLYQPQLTEKPVIDDHGLLQLSGYFATRPEQVEFDLAFQAVGGYWRLYGVRVTTQKVVEVPAASNGQSPTAATAANNQPPVTAAATAAQAQTPDASVPTGPWSLTGQPLPRLSPQ